MPWVTVGVPGGQAERVADGHDGVADHGLCELPKVTVGRFDALLILSSATSLVWS